MKSLIESAFEFARSGEVRNMAELRSKLKAAGHAEAELAEHFNGRGTKMALIRAIEAAKSPVDH